MVCSVSNKEFQSYANIEKSSNEKGLVFEFKPERSCRKKLRELKGDFLFALTKLKSENAEYADMHRLQRIVMKKETGLN